MGRIKLADGLFFAGSMGPANNVSQYIYCGPNRMDRWSFRRTRRETATAKKLANLTVAADPKRLYRVKNVLSPIKCHGLLISNVRSILEFRIKQAQIVVYEMISYGYHGR